MVMFCLKTAYFDIALFLLVILRCVTIKLYQVNWSSILLQLGLPLDIKLCYTF